FKAPRAKDAHTWGSRSPATSAASMRRPVTPKRSETTLPSLRACLKSGLRGTMVALWEPEMEGTDVATLPHGSHRCGMDHCGAAHSSSQIRWSPAHDRHARGGQCHLLYLAKRVSMADAPARLSATPDGVRLLPDLAPRRGVGAHARHPAWGSP